MAGQAVVTIGAKQWLVDIASMPWELTQGLGDLAELAAGAGMLFDTGFEQYITVTTDAMLFDLDIAFLDENMVVVEVVQYFKPGQILTVGRPARFFLEVSSGDLDSIEPGDQAVVEIIASQAAPAWQDMVESLFAAMWALMPLLILGAFGIGVVKGLTGSSDRGSLPEEEVLLERSKLAHHHSPRRSGEPKSDEERAREHQQRFGAGELPARGSGHYSETPPTRGDVEVHAWQERDRLSIWVEDRRTGETIAEWWDDEARQMFEDGFFKPGVPRCSWEKPGREFADSVLDYLEDLGVLAIGPSPGESVKHLRSPFLVNWQYGGYSYVEEDPNKPERLWARGMADYVDPDEVIAIAEREGISEISLAGGFWQGVGYKGWGEKVSISEARRALAKAREHVLGSSLEHRSSPGGKAGLS